MHIGFVGILVIAAIIVGTGAFLVPADVIASNTASTTVGQALVERFVGRSRRFRTIGGLIGIAAAIVATSLRNESSSGVSIEFLPALGGAVVGSILAESFRVRRVRGPRTAHLGVRSEVAYGDDVADLRERFVGAIAVALSVVGLMTGSWTAFALGAVAGTIAAVRRWAQLQVAVRGRPALDAELEAADDEVRRMAVRHGLARPAVTLMALFVAWQAAVLQSAQPEVSAADTVLGLISLALSIAAIVWWWTNRNFGFASLNPRRTRMMLIGVAAVGVLMFLLVFGSRAMQ